MACSESESSFPLTVKGNANAMTMIEKPVVINESKHNQAYLGPVKK